MSLRKLPSLIVVALALLLLGACANDTGPITDPDPDAEPERKSYEVQVHDPNDANPFVLAFFMVSPAALATTAGATDFSATSLTEVQDGWFIGNAADISSAGQSTFYLPTENEIPNAAMRPVNQAFHNVNDRTDCEVQANPATANVTFNLFDEVTVPGPVAFSDTLSVALASDEEINLDTFTTDGARTYTWIYSDSDVSVTFAGAGCAPLAANVDLVEGWNTMMWDYDPAGPALTLTNVDDPETLDITVASGF